MPRLFSASAMPHRALLALAELGRQALQHWPGLCPVCAQWGQGLRCPACNTRFAAPRPRCLRCAVPWPASAGPICTDCLHHPPPQVATVAAVDYAPPWDQLITGLKFRERLDHAPWLGTLLADAVRAHSIRMAQQVTQTTQAATSQTTHTAPAGALLTHLPAVGLVTAVPLSEQRLRERGFNQARLLAQQAARQLRLPLADGLLLRWRSTQAQSKQHSRTQRKANLQGAFMPHPLARQRLAGQHVALVDDVLTTGATLQAAVAALYEGGAAAVSVWVVARTPTPHEREQAGEQAEAQTGETAQEVAHGGDNPPHVSHRFASP